MSNTLRNLVWPDGQANPSGIRSKFFYVRKSDITAFPTMIATPESIADEVTYEGDFELAAGKNFIEVYSTQGVGKVEFEFAGEKDCQAVNNKGSFSYPDLSDEALALVKKMINSNGIIIAGHYVAGRKVAWVVLGSDDFDSEITPKGTSGAKIGEQKGITIEVTAPDYFALPRYVGTIPLENGTFDCATNKFTPKVAA